MRQISKSGIKLLKELEGIKDGNKITPNFDPYDDGYGYATIGYGHAIVHNGKMLRLPEDLKLAKSLYPNGLTLAECESLLKADLINYCRDVEIRVHVPLTDNQFAALVCFQFNTGSLSTSTIWRLLNAKDYKGASEQFPLWNKVTVKDKKTGKKIKVVSKGLSNRRAKEKALFLL